MDYLGETPTLECSEDEQLDIKFRQILYAIKEYIPYVNSNYQLSLYRSWLETLSSSTSDKGERNKYLLELSRQIENKTLLPPFDQHPSTGSIKNLPKINSFRACNLEIPTRNNMTWPLSEEEDTSESTISLLDQSFSTDLSYSNEKKINENQINSYLSSPAAQILDSPKPPSQMEPVDNFYYQPRYDEEEVYETYTETQMTTSTNKKRKPKGGKNTQVKTESNFTKDSHKKLENNSEPALDQISPSRDLPKNDEVPRETEQQGDKAIKDDSSWCDLTDASVTSIVYALAAGDADKGIQTGQQKTEKLTETRRVVQHSISENIGEIETRSAEVEKNISNLAEEVESLKCKDMNQTKYGLKDTNFISADWKKTIESLQLRLTETLNQNNELKAVINALQLKIKDDAAKNEYLNDSKQKIPFDARNTEIEVLKQIQADNIKKLEISFQIKLDEAERNYQQKIEQIKISYDNKVRELKSQHETSKREKDKELFRLTEIIQQQCIRMTTEIAALRNQVQNTIVTNNTSDDKIIVLQKCVSKMDRLFQKSEKDYQKQIEKLKQDLTLKDKVMQIQLKTQRAELITRTSAEKQRQFDDVVNTLEIKYIQMLEYHENQVMEAKIQDEEKIEHLKDLLDKNDIPYDCVL